MKKWLKRFSYTTAVIVGIFALLQGLIFVVRLNATVSMDDTTHQQEAPKLALTVDNLLKLVNREREKAGVAPLQLDERLNKTAQMKADDMARYNYFAHVNPNTGKHGYEYLNDENIQCSPASENLASLVGDMRNAEATVDGWVGSKAHREAILNGKHTLTGFGVAKLNDGRGTYVAVEHFCTPY